MAAEDDRPQPQREADDAARVGSELLDAVDAAVIALDADGLITVWSRGAERLYGWNNSDTVGRRATDLVGPGPARTAGEEMLAQARANGRWEGETDLQRKDGTVFHAYLRIATITEPDGRLLGFVGVSVDITERMQAKQDLLSARDYMRAVTASMGDGLCTLDTSGQIVYLNPRAEQLLGWTTADLAGRNLHEVLHHTRADGAPFPAASCPLVAACRQGSAARVEDDALVRRNGTLLPVRQILTPFETEDGVGGFVLVFSDISERKRRERDADLKLRDLAWIKRIRDAMAHNRFVLHAQPIVELAHGAIVQHELLIRMLDDDGGTVPPAMFLPVAERYGLIGEIDRWVIRQSIGLATRGHAVELNVSAHSLSDPTLYDFVDGELRRTGADPALLVFELTETALLHDEDAAMAFIAAIGERGCRLALDDFGTGYGGFSYLKRLPVDFLKIDTEFVRDLATEPASRKVVESVVSLARDFGIETVAEGVEDAAVLALLREYGVDYAQGYALGRPGPLETTINAGSVVTHA